jgi:hypothetical protein
MKGLSWGYFFLNSLILSTVISLFLEKSKIPSLYSKYFKPHKSAFFSSDLES